MSKLFPSDVAPFHFSQTGHVTGMPDDLLPKEVF